MRHYVYRIEEKYTKEFYWGVRSCKCDPFKDNYLGSMKAWKPNRENLVKTYIREYSTRELANEAEHIIIKYFKNKVMFPLNRNYHDTKNWCTFGLSHSFSEEARKKISKALKNKKQSSETIDNRANKLTGRKHDDETIIKMKNSASGKKFSESHKNKMSKARKGKVLTEETRHKISLALSKKKINLYIQIYSTTNKEKRLHGITRRKFY